MKDCLKKYIKRIGIENSGSAIVIVIIAMAFVGILGATIMWMSLSNFRVKVTDQENKQSFYSAEEIFDQIQIGLQADASEASDYAWSYVMQQYNNIDEANRNREFVTKFKENLIKILSDPASSGHYNISHILAYVDSTSGVTTDSADIGYRYLGTIDTVGNVGGTSNAEIVTYTDKDYILLKNLLLEYTDDNGYYSVISTDIMISAPSVQFTEASSLPEIFKFALVADKGIVIDTPLKVEGSIYAGKDATTNTGGIDCDNIFTVDKAKYVVANGLVDVHSTSMTINRYAEDNNLTQFYSKGINLDGTNAYLEVEKLKS